MTTTIERVAWADPRAVALRSAMDAETSAMYAVFTANNSVEQRAAIDRALTVDPASILQTIIAVDDATGAPVGHSALRPFGDALEVKKVFVAPSHRGTGLSRVLMAELESIAIEHGTARLVLQTGVLQVAAIALYERIGYVRIPAFGAYTVIPNAVCMEKLLAP